MGSVGSDKSGSVNGELVRSQRPIRKGPFSESRVEKRYPLFAPLQIFSPLSYDSTMLVEQVVLGSRYTYGFLHVFKRSKKIKMLS